MLIIIRKDCCKLIPSQSRSLVCWCCSQPPDPLLRWWSPFAPKLALKSTLPLIWTGVSSSWVRSLSQRTQRMDTFWNREKARLPFLLRGWSLFTRFGAWWLPVKLQQPHRRWLAQFSLGSSCYITKNTPLSHSFFLSSLLKFLQWA